MKIRELELYGVRNFPPEGRRISFVDPYTDRPRPLTVLVGSNGAGKTTVLEMVANLAASLDANNEHLPFHLESTERVRGTFAFAEPQHPLVEVALPPPPRDDEVGRVVANLMSLIGHGPVAPPSAGGVIYLEHGRSFPASAFIEIREPDPDDRFVKVIGRGEASNLAQFWLWQNYLDLEAQAEGRSNFSRYIDAIEALLGRDQRVRIRRGRVTIERPQLGDTIEPDHLPSGERQILTIFGEMLRHLRPRSIVLIDEVEISLHPALQRAVIHKLRALAREHDLQVILTTHSMEIVAAVAPDEVVSLDGILMSEGIIPGEKAG